MQTPAASHGFVTKSIHWLAAGLLGYGYLKELDNVRELADPALLQSEVLFALVLGGLFLVRMLWTKYVAGTTRLPQSAPKWERYASYAVKVGLYASVFGIVLSGLGIALGFVAPMLGGLFLSAMIGLHEVTLATLPAFLFIHVLGALWHKIVRRDGVLESMTGRLPI